MNEKFGVVEKRYIDCLELLTLRNFNKTEVTKCLGFNFRSVFQSLQFVKT